MMSLTAPSDKRGATQASADSSVLSEGHPVENDIQFWNDLIELIAEEVRELSNS